MGKAFGLVVVQFGNIGDGNLHPNILFDPRRESEEKVWELANEIARVALRHGGGALRGARHRPHEAGLHAGGGGPRDPGGATPGKGGAGPPGPLQPREGPSLSPVRFSRRFDGGEAIMGPWKASTASFMSSPGWAFLWALGFSSSGIRLGAGSGGSTFSSPSFLCSPFSRGRGGPPASSPTPWGLTSSLSFGGGGTSPGRWASCPLPSTSSWPSPTLSPCPWPWASFGRRSSPPSPFGPRGGPVSYTHLTLPTILLV